MKKIILSLVLGFTLLYANLGVEPASDVDTVDIYLILKSIKSINKQFQQARTDSNQTDISKNFAGIEEKKDDYLKEIPMMIINGKIKTRKNAEEYKIEQDQIQAKIKKYSSLKEKDKNIKEKILLDNSKMSQYFDLALI